MKIIEEYQLKTYNQNLKDFTTKYQDAESFYKHVEPTGVTPFSKPARERALHSVVISLLRQLLPELSAEKSAINFSRDKYRKEIDKITEYLIARNNNIISMINFFFKF